MRESKIEKYLVQQVVLKGGLTRKLKWIGRNDAPDRFVVVDGMSLLVEVKATGEVPRASQVSEIRKLRNAGVRVEVVDSYAAVDELIEGLML